jgi:hypothetical protein
MIRRLDERMAVLGLLFLVVGAIVAFPAGAARADEFWWRLQVNYINGVQDLADQYAANIEAVEGGYGYDYVEVDTLVIPVGISLFPYYQWDFGLMLGAGVGPFMYLWAEGSETYTHWQLPLSVSVGYVLFPKGPVSPYVRGGPSYHLAGGDFYDSSDIGFVAAVGVEFLKGDHFRFGVEAAYDSATVNIEQPEGGTKGIKAAEFSAGAFIQFR